MPRKSPYIISLDKQEVEQLTSVARQYTAPYCEVVRSKVILLAADGLSNLEISGRLDLPRQVVSKWRKRFFAERLTGLQGRPRRGRPRSFPPGSRDAGQGVSVRVA